MSSNFDEKGETLQRATYRRLCVLGLGTSQSEDKSLLGGMTDGFFSELKRNRNPSLSDYFYCRCGDEPYLARSTVPVGTYMGDAEGVIEAIVKKVGIFGRKLPRPGASFEDILTGRAIVLEKYLPFTVYYLSPKIPVEILDPIKGLIQPGARVVFWDKKELILKGFSEEVSQGVMEGEKKMFWYKKEEV